MMSCIHWLEFSFLLNLKPKAITQLLSLCLICCLIGCTKERPNDDSDYIPKLDIEANIKNLREMRLSEIAGSVEYVALQSSPDLLIGFINSIAISAKYIVVEAQNGHDSKIILFDRHGRYIRSIGSQGHGPGEFQLPGVVHLINDTIMIPSRKEILMFDTTGRYINSIPSSEYPISPVVHNWFPLSTREILIQVANYSGNEEFRIVKINNDGALIRGYENSTKFVPFGGSKRAGGTDAAAGYFYQTDAHIRYKEIRNDTIWEVLESELNPAYIFSRGQFGEPADFRTLPSELRFKGMRIKAIGETHEFLLFETRQFGEYYPLSIYNGYNPITGNKIQFEILGVYNKPNNELYFVKPSNYANSEEFPPGIPTGIENDIDGGVNFFPKQSISDSVLVSWIDAYKLIEYTDSDIYKESADTYGTKRADLEKILNKLTANDNPVLIIAKLK